MHRRPSVSKAAPKQQQGHAEPRRLARGAQPPCEERQVSQARPFSPGPLIEGGALQGGRAAHHARHGDLRARGQALLGQLPGVLPEHLPLHLHRRAALRPLSTGLGYPSLATLCAASGHGSDLSRAGCPAAG